MSLEGGMPGMGFQGPGRETQLAKSPWLLELAEHWSERAPEFANQLRMKTRQLRNGQKKN